MAAVLLAAAAILMPAACRPSETALTAGKPAAALNYSLYLFDDFPGTTLLPIDPETLEDVPTGESPAAALVSAGGATAFELEYTAGRANPDPETIRIVRYELPGGDESGRFHPPVAGFIAGMSADGSRLLFQPFPVAPYPYPPPVEYYLLDGTTGDVLAHLLDEDNACFRQSALLDPAGRQLVCAVDPALTGEIGPQPLRLVAYDLESGQQAAALELPGVLLGSSGSQDGESFRQELIEPAVVLSPDGTRIAVVHAGTDAVTLIETAGLTVERTFALRPERSLLDLLGLGASGALAKGELSGVIRQATFSSDGRQLYVYTQELRPTESDAAAGERGLWLVDLERERVTARALPEHQIQWLLPAPDATLYAFGTTDANLGPFEIRETSPSMLWRLDGRTLEILAERAFDGYRGGRLIPLFP